MAESEHEHEQPATTDVEGGGRRLPLAIAVGVVLAGAFLASLFTSPLAFSLVVLVLTIIGVIETGLTFASRDQYVSIPVLVVTSVILLVATYRAGAEGQVVGLLLLFAGVVGWEIASHHRPTVTRKVANTLLIGVWVPFLASFAVLLGTRSVDAPVAVLAVAGAAIIGDIGGYAFGTLFGRRRIAPSISPKKSWEGLIGGLALTGVLGYVVLPATGQMFDDRPWLGVAVAVLSAVAAFFGDLAESMVKRDLGVKDMGSILPGHGGILDRVDGILFALPVGYYVITFVG
jgi:phosphatidate cytidylyltransferase